MLILVALVALVMVFGAYRLDQQRNATNRGLWEMAQDRLARLRSPGEQRPAHAEESSGRSSRLLAALVPMGVVAAVVITGVLLAFSPGDEPAAELDAVAPPTEATPEGSPTAPEALDASAAATATGAAVAVSREAFPDGADNVVLTRQSPSVDALVAGSLQGLLNGPLLLTASEDLSPETAAEIDRLGTPEIHILGGPSAVSSSIENELAAAGHSTHRHAGSTGVETALDIARRHFPGATTAVVAPTFSTGSSTDEAVVQAMTAGALASALEAPVLTTGPDGLSELTGGYIVESGITAVAVVGSASQLSEQVTRDLQALGVSTVRYSGDDRFSTAVAVAGADSWAQPADGGAVLLVEGSGDGVWPGISIAAVYAGQLDAPMLLTDDGALPDATLQALRERPSDTQVVCMANVDDAVCRQAESAVSGQ